MTEAVFDTAVRLTLENEGGFQCDHADKGNWTGGEVGKGELRGTNMGISAAAYPGLDIKNLTRSRAIEIYRTDVWYRYRLFEIPGAVLPIKVFDMAVLIGPGTAIKLLQRVLGCTEDGVIGPNTVTACRRKSDVVKAYVAVLTQHFKDIVAAHPEEGKFLAGWLSRALS